MQPVSLKVTAAVIKPANMNNKKRTLNPHL
jgi:hypothetical protein